MNIAVYTTVCTTVCITVVEERHRQLFSTVGADDCAHFLYIRAVPAAPLHPGRGATQGELFPEARGARREAEDSPHAV